MRPQVSVSCAISANGATTVQQSFDTRGYRHGHFVVSGSAATGLHTTAANTILEESDDASSWTTVDTGVTLDTSSAVTNTAKVLWSVDLRGRKRYIRPKAGLASTGILQLTAVLSGASDAPVTASECGAINFISI